MSSASENAMSDLEANNYTQPYPPMSEPTPREALREKIGQIVSRAIVEMTNENRWYINFSSRDDIETWTKDDFHLLEWDKDMGTIGFGAVDVWHKITPEIERLISAEVLAVLDELGKKQRTYATKDVHQHGTTVHNDVVNAIPLLAITQLKQRYGGKEQ